MTRAALFPLTALALAMLSANPAAATSGWGCYVVNVGPSNPLHVRAEPSATATVVMAIHTGNQPIVALNGVPRGEEIQPSLFDVHSTESDVCVPANLPRGARWCPVSLFDGSGPKEGWLKRRFVDHSECP